MTRRPTPKLSKPGDLEPIIRLWMLRILVPLNGARAFMHPHGFHDETLAEKLGLGHWMSSGPSEFDRKAVRIELRRLYKKAEAQFAGATVRTALRENVSKLAGLMDLDATDCRILEFAVLVHNERELDDTADTMGRLSSSRLFQALAIILALPEPEVRSACSNRSILARSGLLAVDREGTYPMTRKLGLLSADFADRMTTPGLDPLDLVRGTVSAAASAQLGMTDCTHLKTMLDVLRGFLRQAVTTGRRGVNVLLHGAPGTGKSQLARALADELGCGLYEVAGENAEGSPLTGEQRLRAYSAAQRFLAQRHTLIAFDEVEDVFNDGEGLLGRKSTAQLRKSWFNRLLEENPVPALWLSNRIFGMDPAFIRRFDIKVRFDFLCSEQAWALLCRHCTQLGISTPQSALRRRIDRLVKLTPGDFAAVLRQHRFRPIADAAMLVAALEAECALKEGSKAAIGFL